MKIEVKANIYIKYTFPKDHKIDYIVFHMPQSPPCAICDKRHPWMMRKQDDMAPKDITEKQAAVLIKKGKGYKKPRGKKKLNG